MALKKELQEILDELEFDSPEEKADFEKYLAKEKIGAKIEAGYMKNKDYTSKTQSVAEARKQLEAEQARWNEEQDSYLNTMTSYKTDMEKRLNDALAQVSKSRLYGAALETKLNTLAAQYGEDPEELLADVKEMRKDPEKKESPAFDDEEFKKRFVPRDEFQSTAESVFGFAPMLRDLDHEYADLYGKPYKGSMQELVKQGIIEVNQRRARGQKIDLYNFMREKLDFEGQKARNAEASKTQAEEEKKKWQEEQRKEIEQQVRSEYLAANPAAIRQAPEPDAWRQNLSAAARKEKQEATNTATATMRRRQEIHKAFQERQAKSEGAAA